uniref:Transaminase AMT5 n=1 Tax=Alternaria alternata TaxID=5599 RepID=AMT5_ALTAL|nr:RecName: Full=Transaminase AMT5; AltName: Full=AM-toxin biosynthesis protein 5 [Alternaria alternata]BAI44740.1 similar to branched-chain-amino-acid aminotransferase [Alternaria alternata]BAI44804.1 similar to branched-chain-amino-acid aminotransferase [Alternaria alternata]
MASYGFPLTASSLVDWTSLTFSPIEVNGHIQCTYSPEVAEWGAPHFVKDPYLRVHGLAPALNYGQQIFEGMKAFRTPTGSIRLFRPKMNAVRFAHSASFVAIPPVPEALFLRAVHLAVGLNSEFVPPYDSRGSALYIRPIAFASSATVNLAPADHFTFCVFVMPVAPLSTGAGQGLRALVVEDVDRAAPKGTGSAKVGGNYAPIVTTMQRAKADGYGLTLHLDSATHTMVDEFSASGFIGVRVDAGKTTMVVPDSPTILRSITVDSMCRIAESFGWQVQRRAVSFTELAELSEAFAVGTAFILTPVRAITRPCTHTCIEYTADYRSSASAYTRLLETLQGIQQGWLDDAWGWTEEVQDPSSDEFITDTVQARR